MRSKYSHCKYTHIDNIEEAKLVYDKKALELFGKHAKLNHG